MSYKIYHLQRKKICRSQTNMNTIDVLAEPGLITRIIRKKMKIFLHHFELTLFIQI